MQYSSGSKIATFKGENAKCSFASLARKPFCAALWQLQLESRNFPVQRLLLSFDSKVAAGKRELTVQSEVLNMATFECKRSAKKLDFCVSGSKIAIFKYKSANYSVAG